MNPPKTSKSFKAQQNLTVTVKCNQQTKQTTRTNNQQQPKGNQNKPTDKIQSKPQHSTYVKRNQNNVDKPQVVSPVMVEQLTNAFKAGLLMNSVATTTQQTPPPQTNQQKPAAKRQPKTTTQKIVIASSGAKNVVVNVNPKSNIKVQKK